jgi:hypothetical protein
MFWKRKEDEKINNQQPQQYDDIPIITDAEVVEEEIVAATAPPSASAPPAMNPNYKGNKPQPTVVGSAPGAFQVAAPLAQQINPPVNVHVNTHVVAASNTNMVKPKIYTQLGRNATGLQCPHCGRQTVTVVEDYVGVGTVICVIILAILFWPLCWLPLCVPTCKRTHHYCGHFECQKKVGETRVCA